VFRHQPVTQSDGIATEKTTRRRLNHVAETLESMRERRHQRTGEEVPPIEPEAESQLLAHPWPGNVRELDNLMQRARILCNGERITAADIHFEALDGELAAVTVGEDGAATGRLTDDLRSVEEQMILDALRTGSGSRKQAAEMLGISPRTLRYKLQKLREAGVAIPGN